MTNLFDHAESINIPGLLKLDTHLIVLARLFTPDDIADETFVLLRAISRLQQRNTDPNPLQQLERRLRYKGETAQTDIGYRLVNSLVIFIIR